MAKKKSNSLFSDLFKKRTYSSRDKEWTSASHRKSGVPGFSRVESYKGYKVWNDKGNWKTNLDPDSDFDSKPLVKKFIDDWKKRNPTKKKNSSRSVEEMATAFHGRQPLEDIEIVETKEYDKDQAVIGILEELEILCSDGRVIAINFPHYDHRSAFSKQGTKSQSVYVTTDARGKQIGFVGGDQCLPVKEFDSSGKYFVEIGSVYSITYWTDKYHLEDGTGFSSYQHLFGEEGGERPTLMYSTLNKKMQLLGGSYTVEDVGIKD